MVQGPVSDRLKWQTAALITVAPHGAILSTLTKIYALFTDDLFLLGQSFFSFILYLTLSQLTKEIRETLTGLLFPLLPGRVKRKCFHGRNRQGFFLNEMLWGKKE